MKKGAIVVLVSVWVSVAGTGIGLAALINVSTGRLDTRISELAKGQADLRERITRLETIPEQIAELYAQNAELARGQADLRERTTRVETILGEVRDLAAVQESDSGVSADRSRVQEGDDSGALR